MNFTLAPLIIGLAIIAPGPKPLPLPASFSLELTWTAPGDDDRVGRAHDYELRVSTVPITPANFDAATLVRGVPAPSHAGTRERFRVHELDPGTTYYFALKTRDEAGNWSGLSNVAVYPLITTGVGDMPSALEFSAPWPNPARDQARWSFALPEGQAIQVDVFSESGRRVRELASGWRPAGRGELKWDLRDHSGHPVPAGIYLVRARLGGQLMTRTVAVVR